MLLLTRNEISTQFGPSYPTGGARRFNAEAASLHRTPTHVYEFGYLKGYTFYAIVQKRVGNITAAERAALLGSYAKARGEWKPVEDGQPAAGHGFFVPISFAFTPAQDETNFPRPVYAAHQLEGRQFVLWHPECHMDLAQLVATPLVY